MKMNIKKVIDNGLSKVLAVTVVAAVLPGAIVKATKDYIKEKKEQ